MATQSSKIKKALKAAFPTINFSVTYKSPYGYTIKWNDGLVEGATTEAVKEIAGEWDTTKRTELGNGDCYFSGDSVRYDHEITDRDWEQFVIECVLKTACKGVHYDTEWKSFKYQNGERVYHSNKEYNKYLYNGIKTDLNSHDAICDRDRYYKDIDQKKIDQLLEDEKEYLSQFTVDSEYAKYVGKENETIKILSAKVVLDRPDYRIYNREIVYNTYTKSLDKVKPFHELDTEVEFTILDKETNEQRQTFFDSILNIFDPVTPILITDIYKGEYTNKYDWNRKINDFKHYDAALIHQKCLITEAIKLSSEHYDRFSSDLLGHYDWLEGKGGTNTSMNFGNRPFEELSYKEQQLFNEYLYSLCVIVYANDREPILVDPQGYGYARYVAKVAQDIIAYCLTPIEDIDVIDNKVVPLKPKKTQAKIVDSLNSEKYLSQYKNWVSSLIDSDRANEIVSYSEWFKNNSESIQQEAYKSFISDCLTKNTPDKIVSFDEWKKSINIA